MGASASGQRRRKEAKGRRIELLSVVIPALNEEKRLANCLESVEVHGLQSDPEVIVVDGGSTDNTVKLAKKFGARVVSSARGRGIQLNDGWRASRGDWLLFLHADSRLPAHYGRLIESTIQAHSHEASWGCFHTIQTDVDAWAMRLVSFGIKLRTVMLKLPYGDQALFVKASTMKQLDGFQEIPLMEDVDFVQRAKREGFGDPVLIPQPIFTSGRRWQSLGIWKTTLINQGIMVAYLMGVDTQILADWYYRPKQK